MYGVIKAEIIAGSGWAASRPRPWVARIVGSDSIWGLRREFMRGVYDYTLARKSGGRGIHIYWALSPGAYEVYRPVSWKHDERFFIRVTDDGEWRKINREEVGRCLSDTSASAS